MPRLTLYIDLSVNYPFAFATLQAHAAQLERKGSFIPPVFPWNFGKIASHQLLWDSIATDKQQKEMFPHFVQGWLHALSSAAGEGKNVLLYGREWSLLRQKLFFNALRAQKELAAYDVGCVFVIGRPVCLFEQTARLVWPGKRSAAYWYTLAQDCARTAELIEFWRHAVGADNVAVFTDASESAAATGLSCGHIAALAAMGVEAPAPSAPAHLTRLVSREARHLLLLCEVGNNAWPPLDTQMLLATLQDVEQKEGWDALPISSPKYREAVMRHVGRYFSQPGVVSTPDIEGCPARLAPEAEWQDYIQLSEEALEAFMAHLPPPVANALRQRYELDQDRLGQGQKRIHGQLNRRYGISPSCSGQAAEPPLVTVLTMTRNQKAYISQCIESVAEQITDFKVQHIIIDHCSTDGTDDIVRSYAEKFQHIRPVLLSQWISGQNVHGLFSRCRTKFVALCDGDDYFTDPYKLQKQVDFLVCHPECALCFHPVTVIYEDGSPSRTYPTNDLLGGEPRAFYTIKNLLNANFIQTNSVMYRWRFCDGLPKWFDTTLIPGDWYWHLLHAELGSIGYIDKSMSAYRRHSSSLYASAEGDHVLHREIHGLNELKAYTICNQHFHGRYYEDFCRLAMGVFADFVHIYDRTGDDTLLQKGVLLSPEFAHDFLAKLNLQNTTNV